MPHLVIDNENFGDDTPLPLLIEASDGTEILHDNLIIRGFVVAEDVQISTSGAGVPGQLGMSRDTLLVCG